LPDRKPDWRLGTHRTELLAAVCAVVQGCGPLQTFPASLRRDTCCVPRHALRRLGGVRSAVNRSFERAVGGDHAVQPIDFHVGVADPVQQGSGTGWWQVTGQERSPPFFGRRLRYLLHLGGISVKVRTVQVQSECSEYKPTSGRTTRSGLARVQRGSSSDGCGGESP
jgi:hypothetical protein